MKLTSSTVSKLMVGNNAATKAYLGAVEVWSAIDPAITAFATASGATDLVALSNLASYLRGQSLLSSIRCFPFKSAQNAGSGSTVYGWGDLTANNCTLVNSPTWGVGGVTFNGSTQYGSVADFLASETLTTFTRHKFDSLAGAGSNALWSQFETGTNSRILQLAVRNDLAGDPYALSRSSDGGAANLETYIESAASYDTTPKTAVAQWVNGGGRGFWINKTSRAISLQAGTAQTSAHNTSVPILIAATGGSSPVGFSNAEITCQLFITGSITDAQREAITDLINAL